MTYLANTSINISFYDFPLIPVNKVFSLLRVYTAKKLASTVTLFLVLSFVFPLLLSATTETLLAVHTQCSDGSDNDNDGKTDYPQDDDCESLDDDHEGIGLSGNFISLTDGKETVSPGGALVYVLTLKQQRVDSRNVNVTLHLPHQENIASASDGGSVNPGIVHWTNVSVYKNVNRTLTVHVNVKPDAQVGQYLVARAMVDGAEATDTTLIESYVVVPADTYRVSITDDKDFVMPGQSLTYVVRVRNTAGKNTVTDVRVALPYEVNYQSSSAGSLRDSYNVTWKGASFALGEERTFTVTATVDPRAVDRSGIRARATAGTISDLDTTIIRTGLPYDAIITSVSDGRSTAEVGQKLTYVVKVTNQSDTVGTSVFVNAAVPTYAQIVSVSHGGTTDGNAIRWHIVQMAPNETRDFTFIAQVRSDTPLGTTLSASAVADGMNGEISRDSTKIVAQSTEIASAGENVIFRKTADRAEAVPGGSIRYTLFVQNTLDTVIADASILDRYDAEYLSLASADNRHFLASESDGHMEWKIPVLKPGESWQTTYVLSVSANAPTGMMLDNVATLRGADVSGVSLTERVRTNSSGVLGEFPSTGVGMDALLATMLAFVALGATGAQKKLAFGRIFLG